MTLECEGYTVDRIDDPPASVVRRSKFAPLIDHLQQTLPDTWWEVTFDDPNAASSARSSIKRLAGKNDLNITINQRHNKLYIHRM